MTQLTKKGLVQLEVSRQRRLQVLTGYSLIEMLIYISILSIISLLAIDTILSFGPSYHSLLAYRSAENSGILSLERMSRDIRATTSVNTAQSALGTNPGVLTLVATSNGVSTTTKFYIQNNILKVDINGSYSGPLSLSNTSVTNLIFTLLSSPQSSGVKIDMTVQSTSSPITKTKTFHSTIILK